MTDANDLSQFDEDLAHEHVVFVVAKKPTDRLEIDFEGFEVDGNRMPLNRPIPLPANQGFWIDIGAFPAGVEIEVRWRVHTGIEVPEGEILFGHCPNGKLTKLVRLERRTVEPFKTYAGVFKVKPEKL